ncbi:MAG: hypothetical protein ACM31F_00715 [Gemmatimonas sp.]
MYLDPRAVFMLVVLVGVTGWVAKGLMVSFFRLARENKPSSSFAELDERLKKIEAATSGLIMDVAAIREKERFMARLQASAAAKEVQIKADTPKEGELSPLVTQSIPVMPRAHL